MNWLFVGFIETIGDGYIKVLFRVGGYYNVWCLIFDIASNYISNGFSR